METARYVFNHFESRSNRHFAVQYNRILSTLLTADSSYAAGSVLNTQPFIRKSCRCVEPLVLTLCHMELLYEYQVGTSSIQMPEYVRRLFQYPQMDIDYTLWQMLYLCVAPSRVYRTTKYHKQTKNQWARDGK